MRSRSAEIVDADPVALALSRVPIPGCTGWTRRHAPTAQVSTEQAYQYLPKIKWTPATQSWAGRLG